MTTAIPGSGQVTADSHVEPAKSGPAKNEPAQGEPAKSEPARKAKARDPRYLALRNFALSITVFNILGYTVLGFEQAWLFAIFAVITAYATELILETIAAWASRRPARYRGGVRSTYEFLLPAHITALAVNMLLYTNDQVRPIIFGVIVGVSGKYILQAPIKGTMRHFMNPSNLGIVVVLLTCSSWVAIAQPYQFTENVNQYFKLGVPMVILVAGTVLNSTLTKRTPLIVGFMGGFVIQAVVRHSIWDVSLLSALGPMTGVAFVLFANYMISDPGTTPGSPRPQFIFGAAVATVYGVLMVGNVVFTLFFATVIVCALRGGGWWAVHSYKRYRDRRQRAGDQAAPVPGAAPVTAQ